MYTNKSVDQLDGFSSFDGVSNRVRGAVILTLVTSIRYQL